MDNLQAFSLWSEENRAKTIYKGNGIFMPCGVPKEMNVKKLMIFSYDLKSAEDKTRIGEPFISGDTMRHHVPADGPPIQTGSTLGT
jgi:hypothetical protein